MKTKQLDFEGVQISQKQQKNKREIFEDEEDGEIIFEINVGVDPSLPIAPNVDYEFEEMTYFGQNCWSTITFKSRGSTLPSTNLRLNSGSTFVHSRAISWLSVVMYFA